MALRSRSWSHSFNRRVVLAETVATTYQVTRGLLCDAMRSDDERANTPWCDLEL